MKFNIYFDDGVILPTEDIKTAFKACDMPDRVDAVTTVNYNGTEEVLWGKKPCKKPADNASKCWSYPNPIATNASLYRFDAPFVLEVKVHNKETNRFETLCYELDKAGFENSMRDVQTMFFNKSSNWTRTKRILFAKFYSNKDGKLIHECSVYFTF